MEHSEKEGGRKQEKVLIPSDIVLPYVSQTTVEIKKSQTQQVKNMQGKK